MSETKHTLGPWEVKDDRFIDSPSGWIADVLSYPAYRAATGQDSEEQKANARLIAAAPDLYEALTEALRWIGKLSDWYGVGDPDIDKWRATIKKAKGEL